MQGLFGNGRVISDLPPQPPPVAQAEVAAKPKVGVRRDGALARDDFANPLWRNTDVFCKAVFREPQRLEELFFKHLAGRDR